MKSLASNPSSTSLLDTPQHRSTKIEGIEMFNLRFFEQLYDLGSNFSAKSGLMYVPGKGMPSRAIAGTSVAGVVVLLVVFGSVYLGNYRKKKAKGAVRLAPSFDDPSSRSGIDLSIGQPSHLSQPSC
ncbi:hypothetical protein RJ641_015225 [Dillenia turbinata]|uniref:Transmembrane protein n=1 Tax=Dillenia turbinata TaxID=194707 RepID=A0AAN8YZY3_9MAGN